jgi:fluoride exporter
MVMEFTGTAAWPLMTPPLPNGPGRLFFSGEYMLLLYLAVGGALGTLARFTVAGWVYDRAAAGFPWGTLAVNATGSLLIGFVLRALDVMTVTPELRGFITIGLLGGFTTFSSYTWEIVALVRAGQWSVASAYALGSVLVGVLAVLAGIALATLLIRLRTLG